MKSLTTDVIKDMLETKEGVDILYDVYQKIQTGRNLSPSFVWKSECYTVFIHDLYNKEELFKTAMKRRARRPVTIFAIITLLLWNLTYIFQALGANKNSLGVFAIAAVVMTIVSFFTLTVTLIDF